MKLCPFCAEEIQETAIKCRYCNSFLSKQGKNKWYFSPYSLVAAFMAIGPFALPLVWYHPRIKLKTKQIITLIVIIITTLCLMGFIKAMSVIQSYYSMF